MIVEKLYEDLNVQHQNTVPVHAYFVPTSRQAAVIPSPMLRENSDRLQMLSGRKWMFRYYQSIQALREEFYRPGFRPDKAWKQETVPFCWQIKGYDTHQYTNIRYPFPFDPPYVPQANPCGAYLHTFTWHPDSEASLTYLHFEGVDSCFYVWLNGSYVGYSQITHHTSEFDISSLLRVGDNVLAVLVLKWCDGSYLEDQDKFRLSGIIRDVYLVKRPREHVSDYVITTDLSDDMKSAKLHVRFRFNQEPIPIHLCLYKGTALEGEAFLDKGDHACISIDKPSLWNAETPNLYTLLIDTEHETISERVGFRTVSVRGGVLLLNGAPIKFRGVNRHESDPITGSVITRDHVLYDLNMIKLHNFNAVRASHYPNVPYFYQLCDELGLYVIDEADNESHGTAPLYFKEENYAERMKLSHERIADNPDFIAPTLDRVSSMVLRNRNRPSILVWSMGNECGYGCTFEEALRWTKQVDPTRLTHYESAFYMPQDRSYDASNIDLMGRMYPPFDEVEKYCDSEPERPLLLVEYCHSMGNSPGDLKEYRDLTERYPSLCGGFVWEWCDHAIYKGPAANGKSMYWYGGDHGELQHDGNFCLDGLVYPDRIPHTGLYEYKNVHRPLRGCYDADKKLLIISNFWDFLNPASYVKAEFSLTSDGNEVQHGIIPLPDIRPHSSVQLPLVLDVPDKGRCYLNVTYTLLKSLPGLPEGHVLGFDDIALSNKDGRNQDVVSMLAHADKSRTAGTDLPAHPDNPHIKTAPLHSHACISRAAKIELHTINSDLYISGDDFTYVLDTLSGNFSSFRINGREFLRKPVDFNLWRAPTDNDQALAGLWRWERLDHTVTRAYETAWKLEDNTAAVQLRQSVSAMSVQPILRISSVYRIYPDGMISMSICADKDEQIAALPRLGVRMFLSSSLHKAEYFGIGPHESYVDKCRCGRYGLFRSEIKGLHEDYIRPQENGSHCGCDYVRLSGRGMALTAASGDGSTFSFNASVYTQEELEAKRHNYQLMPCGDTVLCIDHKMAGIGSKSCGPDLSEQYRIDDDHYSFVFLIKPDTEG